MTEYNKFKALGYKEENIDEKCTLFFKSNKVLLVRDGKDITELNLDNASYIAISKCSKMRIIRIKSNVMENIAKYYIDENNNMFMADWAMSNRNYWICLNDRTVYYYNKQNNVKCVVNMNEYQYNHLARNMNRQGIVGNIIDDRYLLLGLYLIDLEKREVITYVRNIKAYEKLVCLGMNSSSKLCDMFYSFEHREFFKCTGVGYSLRNYDKDKNYVEYSGYRKRGEETYKVKIRSKEKGNTDFVKSIRLKENGIISLIKGNSGWIVSSRYQ